MTFNSNNNQDAGFNAVKKMFRETENVNRKKNNNNVSGKRLKIEEFAPIPKDAVKEWTLTVGEIATKISAILKATVNGYVGCYPSIYTDNNRTNIYLSIMIKDVTNPSENKFTLINTIKNKSTKNSSNELYNKISRINNMRKFNKSVLSEEGKSMLSDFCSNVNKLKLIEVPNGHDTMIRIESLELIKFLPFIYGDKDEELGILDYTMDLTRHRDQRVNSKDGIGNQIVLVRQYNELNKDDLLSKTTGKFVNNEFIY